MPKSTKVDQINLPERNSAKIRQISAKISPKFAKICQISTKIRQISQISFHKRALTLNTQNSQGKGPKSSPINDQTLFPH